ncbi:uncharacterized protein LOC132786042 [Drosophila nasuta]|uniref:uncharacterized protein LOC132786042 n=1 Tax=Drosophila nasuta TaxID=42062 RepID=UPI00295F4305|nr:uncharacterized protein LOC132786042 [Drosophila nasuta]
MEKTRLRLKQILEQNSQPHLSSSIKELKLKNCKASHHVKNLTNWGRIILLFGLIVFALKYYHSELQGRRCALSLIRPLSYAFRPPENCDFCSQIKSIPYVSKLSPSEFKSYYGYSGAPIVVSDALQNWTASTTFNFRYFQNAYRKARRKQRLRHCQFLPYKTGFQDIYEALEMSPARIDSVMGEAPWYFGWSNCHAETTDQFRKHYSKPYFLPEDSENNVVDWIFMGTAGMGAQMHIDNVRLPSWQAQLAGSKLWVLVPPPECYFRCARFEVIVRQGEMIVLDTNRWYHQTFVQPGAVSITIGAEYD